MEASQLLEFANKRGVEIGIQAGTLSVRPSSSPISSKAKEMIEEMHDELLELLREDPFSDDVWTKQDERSFGAWITGCYPQGVPVCEKVFCIECRETHPGVLARYGCGGRGYICCGCLLAELRSPFPVGARCALCDSLLTIVRRLSTGGPLSCLSCWSRSGRSESRPMKGMVT